MRTRSTCNRRQARENACDQVAIGFASDWLSKWCVIFKPITESSEVNKIYSAFTAFDTQLKAALNTNTIFLSLSIRKGLGLFMFVRVFEWAYVGLHRVCFMISTVSL